MNQKDICKANVRQENDRKYFWRSDDHIDIEKDMQPEETPLRISKQKCTVNPTLHDLGAIPSTFRIKK
jgi:hypothetical protein